MPPVTSVITTSRRIATPSSFTMDVSSRETETRKREVDQFDTGEGHDDSADPEHEQVAAQHRGGADRAIPYAFQRERDQCNDDERIEDHCRQHRACWAREVHH